MKRLAAVCMLIFCLSLPAFAGHQQMGDRWCDCDPVGSVCSCCGGFLGATINQEQDSISQHDLDGVEPTLELSVSRLAVLMWLKVKA